MTEPETLTRSERIRALNDWIEGSDSAILMEALALLCEQLEEMAAQNREDRHRIESNLTDIETAVDRGDL